MRSRPDGRYRRFQVLIKAIAELDYHRTGESLIPADIGCMHGRQRTFGVCVEEKGVETYQASVV